MLLGLNMKVNMRSSLPHQTREESDVKALQAPKQQREGGSKAKTGKVSG